MKTQKLLVIVALVCLMAFLNVLTFAQTAQAEPKPALQMVRFMAQELRAEGYRAIRDGNDLIIEGQVVLKGAFTVQDLEDWADIKVRLVEPEEMRDASGERIIEFQQLRQCWNTAEFIFNWQYTTCELHPNQAGDLICKVGALAEAVLNDLKCILAYLD